MSGQGKRSDDTAGSERPHVDGSEWGGRGPEPRSVSSL